MNYLSVFIFSCDKNKSLWKPFFALWKLNWMDRTVDTFLVTDTHVPTIENVHIVTVGQNCSFSEKMRLALEHCASKYILFLLDDYFLSKPLQNVVLFELMDTIVSEDITYCRLNNEPPCLHKYKGYKDLKRISNTQSYGLNMQPSIWNKDFLQSLISSENLNPWQQEVYFNTVCHNSIKSNNVVSTKKIYDMQHGLLRGKYFPKASRLLKQLNLFPEDNDKLTLTAVETCLFYVKNFVGKWTPTKFKRIIKHLLRVFGVEFYSK